LLVIITLSHFIRLSNCRRKTAKTKMRDAWDDLDKISKDNTEDEKIINNAFKEISNRLKEASTFEEKKSFEDNFTILVCGLAYGWKQDKTTCIQNFAEVSKNIIQYIDKLASSAIDESGKKVIGGEEVISEKDMKISDLDFLKHITTDDVITSLAKYLMTFDDSMKNKKKSARKFRFSQKKGGWTNDFHEFLALIYGVVAGTVDHVVDGVVKGVVDGVVKDVANRVAKRVVDAAISLFESAGRNTKKVIFAGSIMAALYFAYRNLKLRCRKLKVSLVLAVIERKIASAIKLLEEMKDSFCFFFLKMI